MKYDKHLAELIDTFMNTGDQWKSSYTIDLLYYVWENYTDYWEDGERMQFLDDHGHIAKHMMKRAPHPETILRHRRKVKADHNKRVNVDGIGVYWEENTTDQEEETITNFIKT